MARQTLIRWLHLIKNSPNSRVTGDFEVFLISEIQSQNEIPPLLKQYFPNVDTRKTLKDFTISDLFFGSIHFAGHPNKKNLSFYEKFKRMIVRSFFINYEKTAAIWNLVDLIFLPSSEKNLFTPSAHVVDIYKTHLPHFSVKELSSYSGKFRNFLIYMLALLSRRHFQEHNEGVTIFANMADPFLLRAYKLLHPNKNIYLRLHDGLDHMTSEDNYTRFRKQLHKLIDKKIIQGAESYYEPDASFLGILFRPNAVNSKVMQNINYSFRNYFYTFIGAYKSQEDQSRLDDLEKVRTQLCCLYPSIKKYINEYIIFVENFDKERISYSQYLKLVGQSEVIVDMYRIAPDEGLSFRIAEALMLGRKVITNRSIILKYDFYDPSRFFIIGHDPQDRLREFIRNDFKPLPPEVSKRYDCHYW